MSSFVTKLYLEQNTFRASLEVLGDYLQCFGCWCQKLVNYYLGIEEVKYLSDQGCIIIYWREKNVIIREKSYFINQHQGRLSWGLALY